MPSTGFLVAVAVVYCAARLAHLAAVTGVAPSRFRSLPMGSARDGVAYALGRGLSPLTKESARQHLAVLAVGALFHIGLFAAAATLVATLITGAAPTWPAAWSVPLAAGVCAGCVLLVRRLRSSLLRGISVPDDIISNLLATCFVAAALLATWVASAAWLSYVVAIALLLYTPAGKIRHCLFFFVARARFGALFGHRGVLPPAVHKGKA